MLYYRVMEDQDKYLTVKQFTDELKAQLEQFDKSWVAFEQFYVKELMIIEKDARRFITESIKTEQKLAILEKEE